MFNFCFFFCLILVPHIGHLYTNVYADAIFRFSQMINTDEMHIFSTGTDEHGLKVVLKCFFNIMT